VSELKVPFMFQAREKNESITDKFITIDNITIIILLSVFLR